MLGGFADFVGQFGRRSLNDEIRCARLAASEMVVWSEIAAANNAAARKMRASMLWVSAGTIRAGSESAAIRAAWWVNRAVGDEFGPRR